MLTKLGLPQGVMLNNQFYEENVVLLFTQDTFKNTILRG